MTKRTRPLQRTDSASGDNSSKAATETREPKPMCIAMDEPPEGAYLKEMVRCKYAVEPGRQLCAKHIFIRQAKAQKAAENLPLKHETR